MKEKKTDRKEETKASPEGRVYEPPRLTSRGKVEEVTLGNTGALADVTIIGSQ